MSNITDNTFTFSSRMKILSFVLIFIGVCSVSIGFALNPARTWANFLIGNYFFISITVGATFFMAIQNITQAGWSSMFKRVPEAISGWLPFAMILMLILVLFGSGYIYHWTNETVVKNDVILQHKAPYLNLPFFIIRCIIFTGVWVILTKILRKFSLNEDKEGGLIYFNKSEFYSKVYIFTLALTFSLATFDWIMSIDARWFSTIFAVKNFISSFYHGSACIVLIVILLYKQGYFPRLNQDHLHDFSKYIFMLSIMWGYVWFAQYFLIWYGNLPEETVYYSVRTGREWNIVFYADLIINWMFPFIFLMLNRIAKNMNSLLFASVAVLIGLWIELYLQVMPGVTGINSIGFIEIGVFAGFSGIFVFVIASTLSKANIIPVNHPYLEESLFHKLH